MKNKIFHILSVVLGIGSMGNSFGVSMHLMYLSNMFNTGSLFGLIVFLFLPVYFIVLLIYAHNRLYKNPVLRYFIFSYAAFGGCINFYILSDGLLEEMSIAGFSKTLKFYSDVGVMVLMSFFFCVFLIANEISIIKKRRMDNTM